MANAKHWVNNNQETNRGAVAELVDERTRFEMYYPPFVGAVEAGVGSFMCRGVKLLTSNFSCVHRNSCFSCVIPEAWLSVARKADSQASDEI